MRIIRGMGSGIVRQYRWHIEAWPPLAWLETIIKLVALAVGMSVFLDVSGNGDVDLPGGVRFLQLVILVVLSLGLTLAIGDRLIEREVVSMVFIIFNNLGHWGMALALVLGDTSHALALFAALMLAGDLVKMLFIAVHRDFTVRDHPRLLLYGLTGVYVAGYGLILILETMR